MKKYILVSILFVNLQVEAGIKSSLSKIFNRISDNFYQVENYPLYRSKQLSYKTEKKYLDKKNIKITLNLRGYHPEESYWNAQKKAAEDARAIFVYAKTSENSFPEMHELLVMLSVIHNPAGIINDPSRIQVDPYRYLNNYVESYVPIKVNCKAGVDRTGMFSAIYIIEKELKSGMNYSSSKKILNRAKKQLSFTKGHLKSSHPTMDKFVEKWWQLRVANQNLKTALTFY